MMTHNQINYWNLVETRRANQAKERENFRHNAATENVAQGNLNESVRHNKASESLDRSKLAETTRHNVVTETETGRHNLAQEALTSATTQLGYAQLAETSRHNKANEGISFNSYLESSRHNIMQERETSRHNIEQEKISNAANQINSGYLANQKNVTAETIRHNKEMEFYEGTKQILSGAQSLLGAAVRLK